MSIRYFVECTPPQCSPHDSTSKNNTIASLSHNEKGMGSINIFWFEIGHGTALGQCTRTRSKFGCSFGCKKTLKAIQICKNIVTLVDSLEYNLSVSLDLYRSSVDEERKSEFVSIQREKVLASAKNNVHTHLVEIISLICFHLPFP